MKICNTCNTAINDEASFCPNCGQHLPEGASTYRSRMDKEPITVGGWIGRTLIPCIPLVGGIVYLIMLFIWSGSKDKEETFRNWAKAQLIVIGVIVALAIVSALVFGTALTDFLDSI
jgi:uncharacterized membrane protein YvbJ